MQTNPSTQPGYALPRSTPEAEGLSSAAILAFVQRLEQTISHVHSLVLLRHGAVVAEGGWRPYHPNTPHMLFSLSKSFTSTAIGLLVAEGQLSVDDLVLMFFPGEAPRRVSRNLATMQVHHLLSMSTGHHQDPSERVFTSRNPFKTFFALPVEHAPGTHFCYNTAATFMLAAIVQRLSGQHLVDYLLPRVFTPLGIPRPVWESHPNGVAFGGFGLSLTTEAIARFGQLYLQKGTWRGQQLIPASWVETASASHIYNGPNESPDWEQGYGYQFWRCQPPGAYRGDGAFGQFCVVLPEQDLVLAFTGGMPEMQPLLTLAWEHLLPACAPGPLPAEPATHQALLDTLGSLAIPSQAGRPASELAGRISGTTYTFPTNPLTLAALRFDFAANRLEYRLLGGGQRRGWHSLAFGTAGWMAGQSWHGCHQPGLVIPPPAAASGAWTSEDTFTLLIVQTETPFITTLTCTFTAEGIRLNYRANLSFGEPCELPNLEGISKTGK